MSGERFVLVSLRVVFTSGCFIEMFVSFFFLCEGELIDSKRNGTSYGFKINYVGERLFIFRLFLFWRAEFRVLFYS